MAIYKNISKEQEKELQEGIKNYNENTDDFDSIEALIQVITFFLFIGVLVKFVSIFINVVEK